MLNPRWFPPTVRSDDTRKQDYERMIRGGASSLSRLKEIINNEVASLEAPKKLVDYEQPGWHYKQADRLGQLRAYQSILTLLEFIDDKHNSKS